jgi:VWFA-related protein
MTRAGRAATVLCVAGMVTVHVFARQQAPPQVFRSYVDAVLVDVAVTDGHTPVDGLGLADFEVTDNGVKQTIRSVTLETLPLDVSLVVDTSSSVVPVLAQFSTDVRGIAGLLRSADRLRVTTVATGIAATVPLQPADAPIAFDAIRGGGLTALNDALLYALVQTTPPDRRQLVVAFTDGADNWSWLEETRLPAVAARADARLDVVVGGRSDESARSWRFQAGSVLPQGMRDPDAALAPPYLIAAARATGGEVHDLGASQTLVSSFAGLIEQFRRSYLVAYVPSGVKRGGWHDLSVKVPTSKKYAVHARKGYVGG